MILYRKKTKHSVLFKSLEPHISLIEVVFVNSPSSFLKVFQSSSLDKSL